MKTRITRKYDTNKRVLREKEIERAEREKEYKKKERKIRIGEVRI